MIDSHCHLTYPQLASQLPEVLARASAAGVARMVTIGTDLADAGRAIDLCRKLPHVRCAIGIHPNHTAQATVGDIEQLRVLQADSAVLAIGEMGLDYHWNDSPPDHQQRMFEAQLQLAIDVAKPVVIHCREAFGDTLAVMSGFANLAAVFHCFTGTIDDAKRVLDRGYLLGFTGPITYKKSEALRKVVQLTPLDRLLIETDAPYLSPEPMRKQKINEPALVVHTAAVVASIHGRSIDDIDAITTRNALRFYRWT